MTDRRVRDPYAVPNAEPPFEPERRGSRVSPGLVFLLIAVIGSVAFFAYFLTVREATQIPLLAAGAVVLAIVFTALAVYCLRSVWLLGTERGRTGRVLLTALVGGGAAIVAAAFAAGALILIQIARSG
jgi:hypothetical protein